MVNGLDALVFQRLESNGLVFSSPAAKRHLLRRVYFDLTGLPPSIKEAEAFLADSSANAYEKLIDRLLPSVGYGTGLIWFVSARPMDIAVITRSPKAGDTVTM